MASGEHTLCRSQPKHIDAASWGCDGLAIDPQLIEVSSCLVDDYYPLVDSEKWCVAAICASEHNCADGIGQMERHNETDEVFVLMRGESVLFVATGQCECVLAG